MIGSRQLIHLLADARSSFMVTPILDAKRQIGDTSIDIRLGPDIIVSRRATGALAFDASDYRQFEESLRRRQTYVRRRLGDSFHLQPGEFVIARSLEYVALPSNVSAQALGRSSWGRLGLVIATATLVQPGFRGTITLELANVANTALVLQVGLPIAQLVFEQTAEPPMSRLQREMKRRRSPVRSSRSAVWATKHQRSTSDQGRYLNQVRPALSRLHKDPDLRWAAPMALRYMVGVVGFSHSGRASVTNFLVSRRGFRLYRMVHVLRTYAERWGYDPDDPDPEVLNMVGDEIVKRLDDPAAVAKLTFMRLRSDLIDADRRRDPEPVVIEGFKRPEELRIFQRLAAFRTMLVDTSPETRLRRAERDSWLIGHPNLHELPPEPEEDDDAVRAARLEWLRIHIDEKPERRYRNQPLVDLARRDPDLIRIREPDGQPLRDNLNAQLARLDREWRQGLFESDPLNIERRSGLA